MPKADAMEKLAATGAWCRRHFAPIYMLFMLILMCALAWQLRTLPWREAFNSMRSAKLPALLLGICGELAVIPLWALQWCFLAPATHPVRVIVMAEIVTISSAIQNTVPFFGGPLSAGVLLRIRAGFANGAVLSLLAMDQLATGIGKAAAIAAALIAAPLPPIVHSAAMFLITGVLALFLVLLTMTHASEKIRRLSLSLSKRWRRIFVSVAEWAAFLEPLTAAEARRRDCRSRDRKKGGGCRCNHGDLICLWHSAECGERRYDRRDPRLVNDDPGHAGQSRRLRGDGFLRLPIVRYPGRERSRGRGASAFLRPDAEPGDRLPLDIVSAILSRGRAPHPRGRIEIRASSVAWSITGRLPGRAVAARFDDSRAVWSQDRAGTGSSGGWIG